MGERFRIVPIGDSTLGVQFDARLDLGINREAIRLAERLREATLPGLLDIVPTFHTVGVYFDPLRTNGQLLRETLQSLASTPERADAETTGVVRVPMCYGGDLGPDLSAVAAAKGIREDDVVAIHSSTTYRVFMVGFAPGFAYMGPVDARIAVPRLSVPRTRVPAGSVGIGGEQTGIYPLETPGGWQLIGRTRVRPFDPDRAAPFLFKAGDRVRFEAITRADYDKAPDAGADVARDPGTAGR